MAQEKKKTVVASELIMRQQEELSKNVNEEISGSDPTEEKAKAAIDKATTSVVKSVK